MAWVTCSMPCDCLRPALAISVTSLTTDWKLSTTSSIVAPASLTSCPPSPILPSDSSIRILISFAAEALRCESARTSVATTAKPRPCSPARAASTAAFRARMLGWKAIPSMTPTMSAILRELSWIVLIVSTTLLTVSLPRAAIPAECLA